MTPDFINALFEIAGALLTCMNTVQIRRDRGYAGVYMPAIILFTSWGFWNLYYYSHLAQWWSVGATVIMVLANCSWLGHMLWYGRKR